MRLLGLMDLAAAWGLILLGCVHVLVAAPMSYSGVSERLFWFAGSGLALGYAGGLNLARRAAPASRTVRYACLLADLSLLAFVAAFGWFTGQIARPSGLLLVALAVIATLFSAAAALPRDASSSPASRS